MRSAVRPLSGSRFATCVLLRLSSRSAVRPLSCSTFATFVQLRSSVSSALWALSGSRFATCVLLRLAPERCQALDRLDVRDLSAVEV